MSSGRPGTGIERAVFGDGVRDGDVAVWLDEHLRARLGSGLARVLFRSGRVAVVCGAVLADGRHVAVKVHRRGVDVGDPSRGSPTLPRGIRSTPCRPIGTPT